MTHGYYTNRDLFRDPILKVRPDYIGNLPRHTNHLLYL